MSETRLTFRELSDGAHTSPDEVAAMEFGIVANVIETDRLARTGALNKFADDLRKTQINRRNAPATKSQPK